MTDTKEGCRRGGCAEVEVRFMCVACHRLAMDRLKALLPGKRVSADD